MHLRCSPNASTSKRGASRGKKNHCRIYTPTYETQIVAAAEGRERERERQTAPSTIMDGASEVGSTTSSSAQGHRVKAELALLREKHRVKSRRDKLKDLHAPLTTPEEAQAFLAAMRDKSHQREALHRPPSHLSADGMDAWYLQQRQYQRELKARRKEAEHILRSYRGSTDGYQKGAAAAKDRRTSVESMYMGSQAAGGMNDISGEYHVDARAAPVSRVNRHFRRHEREDMVDPVDEEKKSDAEDELRVSLQRQQQIIEEDEANRNMMSLQIKSSSRSDEERLRNNPSPHREVTVWRDFISAAPGSDFPPAAGRYHLYCSYACPGSHRALIVRALKGLEHVISVTFVHPVWRLTREGQSDDKHRGWVFANPTGQPFHNTIARGGPFPPVYPGTEPDPELGAFSIRELYEHAGDTSGKYTIPLLWDKHHKTIVNNESSDICYCLNSCFNEFALNPQLDLYTEDDQDRVGKLNEVSEWLSPLMIHGVYRCGFAKNQASYDKAVDQLCLAFDTADDLLQKQPYLTGATLTDADLRLFVTLLRFDEVYSVYFRANARMVMLTPSLLDFCRVIYQLPGVAETCQMDHIKAHFFASHAEWNKYSVIPRGLGFMELLDMPPSTPRGSSSQDDEDDYMEPFENDLSPTSSNNYEM